MGVRPVLFHESGDIDVVFDEMGHSGTIPAAEVQWATNMQGEHDHNFIVLNCPDGCGASSTHPVGGGAAPAEVQQMFVNKMVQEGCPCYGASQTAMSQADATAHTKELVVAMDGEARWVLEQAPT